MFLPESHMSIPPRNLDIKGPTEVPQPARSALTSFEMHLSSIKDHQTISRIISRIHLPRCKGRLLNCKKGQPPAHCESSYRQARRIWFSNLGTTSSPRTWCKGIWLRDGSHVQWRSMTCPHPVLICGIRGLLLPPRQYQSRKFWETQWPKGPKYVQNPKGHSIVLLGQYRFPIHG